MIKTCFLNMSIKKIERANNIRLFTKRHLSKLYQHHRWSKNGKFLYCNCHTYQQTADKLANFRHFPILPLSQVVRIDERVIKKSVLPWDCSIISSIHTNINTSKNCWRRKYSVMWQICAFFYFYFSIIYGPDKDRKVLFWYNP